MWLSPKFKVRTLFSLSIERMSDSTWFTPSTAEHDAYRKLSRIEVIHLKLF